MASNRLDEQDLLETMLAGGEDDENDPSAMSLVDHLEELRWRIFKSLIAIAVGTIIAFIFRGYIVQFLQQPLPQTADSLTHGKPVVTGITEGFSVFLFALGVSLGYIVLRYPVEWLVTFASDSFAELVTAGSYFTFVAFFMLAFGLVFELPLVLTFLAQVDLITSRTLIRKRASSHIGLWIASTFLTPGADIYSPLFLGTAMSCLYELSIIFIKITKK